MATYTFIKAGIVGSEVYDSLEEAVGGATRDMLSGTAWPESIMDRGIGISVTDLEALCFDGLSFTDEEKTMVLQRAKQQQNAVSKSRSIPNDVNLSGFMEGF